MDYALANDLIQRLKRHSPVRSGALRMSVQQAQGSPREWVILIGNQQGKEINGSCATVEYASITNFAQVLTIRGRTYSNKNYHWVNRAIEEWVSANQLDMNAETEEDEEDVL